MNGNEAILYWNDEPIACLTSNSMSEVLSFLTTCKTTQAGALKFIPVANSYTINFEAVMITDDLMSWDSLSTLTRGMELGSWELSGIQDSGFGHLSNLEMVASSDGIITFTGAILGYGEIVPTDRIFNVWYQDVDTYVNNVMKYVFVN